MHPPYWFIVSLKCEKVVKFNKLVKQIKSFNLNCRQFKQHYWKKYEI